MKISLFVAPLLAGTLSLHSFAADLKKPGPSPSDALFDPSRVIQIEIRLDPKDWHALRISHPVIDDNGDISITEKGYEYYRADALIEGRTVKSVGVRKKGSWSLKSSRPSLKIKLDEYVKDQEFDGLDMITLNNLMMDPSKAQQVLVYSFMSQAGVLAPRANLVRVIVNGEDLGIYGQVESIRKPFIKRFFKNANGDLYESATGDLTTNRLRHLCQDDRVGPPAKAVNESVGRIPRFVESRRKDVQAELNAPAPDWPIAREVRQPVVIQGKPMQVEGSFSAAVGETFPMNLIGHGSANLEFTVEGKARKPFTRFGAAAISGLGGDASGDFATVQILAMDGSGDLRWNLNFRIDRYRLAPGKMELEPHALWATLAQGDPRLPSAQWRRVLSRHRLKGTVELEQTSTYIGGRISGTFRLNTTAFAEEKKP